MLAAEVGPRLAAQPKLLPAHYTGFVASDNRVYKPIRDAGLATGKLQPTDVDKLKAMVHVKDEDIDAVDRR